MWTDLQFPNWGDRGQIDTQPKETDEEIFKRLKEEAGAKP